MNESSKNKIQFIRFQGICMKKLKIYRFARFIGQTLLIVTVAGFSNSYSTNSRSSAYFFHPKSSNLHEYYQLSDHQSLDLDKKNLEYTEGIKNTAQPGNLQLNPPSGSAAPPPAKFTSPFKPPKTSSEQNSEVESNPPASFPTSLTPLSPSSEPSSSSEMPGQPVPYQSGQQTYSPYEPQGPVTTILPTNPLDPSTGPLQAASTLSMLNKASSKETYTINYNNISIVEFIRFISQISNTNFYFQEDDLQFNVSIVSEEPANIEDIISALIQVLRMHGFSLTEQGNNLLIYRNADISRIAPIVTDENQVFNVPIITRVIRLNYVTPDKIKSIIQPLLSSQALIEVSPETRHLVITDVATNIDKIIKLLASLDTPHSVVEIGTYFTQYSMAANLIALAERILAPIAIADNATITLVPQPSTNTIFIVSTPDLLNRTISILEALDKPLPAENEMLPRNSAIEIANYMSQNVPPAALIPLAERILNPIAQAENALLTIVQQPATNLIFIISTPEIIQRALSVFRSLDQGAAGQALLNQLEDGRFGPPPPPDIPSTDMEGTILYLYKLQFLKGEKIEIALQDIGASLAKTGLANADLISTINSMQWIEPNNSLLFVGTPSSIEKVKEFLRTLDRPLRQIFLEVLVIQTSLSNSLNFGVQWGVNGINGQTLFGNAGLFDGNNLFAPNFVFPQVNNIPGVVQPNLALTPGFNLGVIGNLLTHNGQVFASIGALLQALQTEIQTKVLLNPKIVTEDNNTAQIFVGQNIPFTTANVQIQAANNSTGFNIDYRDVGVLLEITPYLGSSDIVTLDIHQEINNVDTTGSNNSAVPTVPNQIDGFPIPTTNKILTTTRVHVPHNYFLIISGQINEQRTYVRQGLPCLGCLPVVGAAFSQQQSSIVKQNVIIFIHPKIIDTRYDIAQITDEQGCDFERHSEAHYAGHKTPCGRYLKEECCIEPERHPPARYPIGYCPGPNTYPDYPCEVYYPGYPFSGPRTAPTSERMVETNYEYRCAPNNLPNGRPR